MIRLLLNLGFAIVLMGNGLYFMMSATTERDDTDSVTARSGMHLYTDRKTGCQYLGVWFGGLTPRLDAAGRHICGVRL